MNNDRAFDLLEKEKLDPPEEELRCCLCDREIRLLEMYFDIRGDIYCEDCADSEFVRIND